MKIIFLDIDGVLNHQAYYESDRWDKSGKRDSDIDPKSVEILNGIIKNTGAKVVISSTWRIGRTIEELQQALERKGFTGEIIDFTDRLFFTGGGNYTACRGDEIYKWIKDNEELIGSKYYEYKSYVILDDDSDMLLGQANNYINIDQFVGITLKTAFKAEKILGKI